MSQILYTESNGLLAMPVDWEKQYRRNEPCDMLVGPCACGAWHRPECWTSLLNRYDTEIRDYHPDGAPGIHNLGDLAAQKNLTTLSYF